MSGLFKGYGRGWGEEKARGLWPRFKQRMREPATTLDYALAAALLGVGLSVLILGAAP